MFNGEDFVANFANSYGVFCHFMFKDILEESYDEYIYIYIVIAYYSLQYNRLIILQRSYGSI